MHPHNICFTTSDLKGREMANTNLQTQKANAGTTITFEQRLAAIEAAHVADETVLNQRDQAYQGPIAAFAVDGAIPPTTGTAMLTKGSIGAYTLAAPSAGSPSAGGQDGLTICIIAGTAFAHVVTCPANKINTNKLTATWTAAVGNSIELVAFNGVWYTLGTPSGVALA